MSEELNRLYDEALLLMEDDRFEEAAAVLHQIVSNNPEYEHGQAYLMLADCYEECGKLEEAESCYHEALRREPLNPYNLGNYASYLYLHGSPKRALEVYCELYVIEAPQGLDNEDATTVGIRELAQRLNLTIDEVNVEIERASERIKAILS